MSSPRRENSRRPSNPPNQHPTDPVTLVTSHGTASKTPHCRPNPHPSKSASSTSSAASSNDNDTIFDDIRSRSDTPGSPFTPLEPSPNSPSRPLFSDEVDVRISGKFLGEPLDLEAPERRLYMILSEVGAPPPYTPSKKSGQQPRARRKTPSTSTVNTERPILHRKSHIDNVLQHQRRPECSTVSGTINSHNPEADMGTYYAGPHPAASPTDESPQHTNEPCQAFEEFVDTPTVAYLINQAHHLRPVDWQFLRSILREDKQARMDLQHLKEVLRVKIRKLASNLSALSSQPVKTTNFRQKALNFVPWKQEKDPRQINSAIHECMKRRIRPTKEPIEPPVTAPELGWIYVFESPKNAPGHVKIGKTKGEPQKRRTEWEMCGITLTEVEDSDRNAFGHYSVVESLIKAELHNKRRAYECGHHTKPVKHEEWYEIEKKTALDSVSRWRQWLKDKAPFDNRGLLTPYWNWRVQKLPKSIDNVDWDRWTRPSPFDYLDFQFFQFGQGYYTQIRAHLCRKDFHFCLTGGMMVFILYTQSGLAGALWGLLALLIL